MIYIPHIYIVYLLPIHLSLLILMLGTLLRLKLLRIDLKPLRHLQRRLARDSIESQRGDIVRLSFFDERVVLEQVLQL
jgi:hypothetical protein